MYLLFPELFNILKGIQPAKGILLDQIVSKDVTKFVLDPTAINLSDRYMVPVQHPKISKLFRLARDWCYAVTCNRSKLLYSKNASKNN
jgi:hypothetical protein